MDSRFFAILVLIIAVVLAASPHPAQADDPPEGGQQYLSSVLRGDYIHILERYVNDDGLVDYAGLKADREGLDAFVEALGALEPELLDRVYDKDRMSMWINAYNALTLKVIIDHYPISRSRKKTPEYPANSIRQIPGVWDDLKFTIVGRELSLNQIEHEILRARFDEPRIHMALVCAAVGCPPLRRERYIGVDLNMQLDDQTRRFLENPRNLRINREAGIVYLSSIFEWFAEDFGDVVAFVSRYVSEGDRQFLLEAKYKITYLPYDWTLNDQAVAGE